MAMAARAYPPIPRPLQGCRRTPNPAEIRSTRKQASRKTSVVEQNEKEIREGGERLTKLTSEIGTSAYGLHSD